MRARPAIIFFEMVLEIDDAGQARHDECRHLNQNTFASRECAEP